MAEEAEKNSRAGETLTARLAGAGVRGVERVAAVTGVDRALDRAAEEAIVRALESPAVERALIRVLESPAAEASMERMLASEELERALLKVLDSELVDRVWDRLLASDETQKLIERIASAPEIRQAIASQGLGLLSDLGRQLRRLTDHIDDGLERLVGSRRAEPPIAGPGVAVAPGAEAGATPRKSIGLVTRALAALIDGAVLNGIFLITTALIGFVFSSLFELEGASGPVIAFGAGAWLFFGSIYLLVFWSLAGQTPGMRLLSIRIEHEGSPRLGWRCAMRRLLGVGLSVLAFGLPFLVALRDPRTRAFHDRLARTRVVAFDPIAEWVRVPTSG